MAAQPWMSSKKSTRVCRLFVPISSDKFPLEATSQIQELVAVQILFLYIPYAVIEFQTF